MMDERQVAQIEKLNACHDKMMKSHSYTYLPHIDGLRALAISLVVIFHAFPEVISGGFIGVDVFFVISGYLITGILIKEIQAKTYTLKSFYARRIKRIFPALALVLTVTLLFGWAVLLETEFQQLGKHAAGGGGFIANLVLWQEVGYFDVKSEYKPLLHLWSLGIEEQFYLFWPLLLPFILRWSEKAFNIIVLIAIVSFVLNILIFDRTSSSAFYLPIPRFWELLAGSILVFLHSSSSSFRWAALHIKAPTTQVSSQARASQELQFILALALIMGPALLLNSESAFPSWNALMPILGTVLAIHSGSHSFIGRKLLSNPISIFFGLISYPLYLWHWPLFSFAKIIDPHLERSLLYLTLILVAILLAFITYRFIEKPLRRAAKNPQKNNLIIVAILFLVLSISICGIFIYKGSIASRLNGLAEISRATSDWDFPGDKDAYTQGGAAETILFFGDSFVQQLYPRIKYLAEKYPQKIKTVAFHTSGGCAPVPGINRISKPYCQSHAVQGFIKAASKEVSTIIIGGSWVGLEMRGDYFKVDDPSQQPIDFHSDADWVYENLLSHIQQLKKQGKKIYLVLNPPGGGIANPGAIENRLTASNTLQVKKQPIKTHLERTGKVNNRLIKLANIAQIKIIDPTKWLCRGGECWFTDAFGVPYFKDITHLRASYVGCCVTAFDEIVLTE